MKKISLITLLLALPACSEIPAAAYYDRGDPENLLDVSSEVVNMNLSSATAMHELTAMVSQDPPTRVEMTCSPKDGLCMEVRRMFEQYAVPVDPSDAHGITMIYERVVARDCEGRFIDNSINPYNLNHPTLGCSVAANTVQMVSDKRQFTNPSLLDYSDGEKAQQVYRVYLTPPSAPNTANESILNTIQQSN
ncbi:MAG: hypothetical protein ACK502_08110 [Alphaproteobacteria bacterium]